MKIKIFVAFIMIAAFFSAVGIQAQPGGGGSTPTTTYQVRQPLAISCPTLRSRVDGNQSEVYDPTKFYKTKIKSYQTFLQKFTPYDRFGPGEERIVAGYVQCKFEFEQCGITGMVRYDPNEIFMFATDETDRFIRLAGYFNALKVCDTIKTAFAANKPVKLWYYYFSTANLISVYSAELVNE